MNQGVLTGCNEAQEWLLKTWWNYYEKSNSYPVTFADFGMSKSARMWCEKRGNVISISPHDNAAEVAMEPKRANIYNKVLEPKLEARPCYFAKPEAMLQTPYDATVWVDLDTLILRSLGPLFDDCEETGLAAVRESEANETLQHKIGFHFHKGPLYNTGVMSFKKNHPILKKWAAASLTDSSQYHGDQDLLCHLAYQENVKFKEVSPIYNWRPITGEPIPDDVAILHYSGSGKYALYAQLNV